MARDDARRARRGTARARRRDRRARGRAGRARVAERRQAARGREGGDSGLLRQPALLRRRGAPARGQVGGRIHARLHLVRPARAGRDRRRDRALELPADDGGLEARSRARGRERAGAEALRADAADDAALRRAGRGRAPGGGAERDHGRRRARRRRDRPPSRRAHGLADRRRRNGERGRPRRRRHAQARPPRARRQGAGTRLRRRRPGRRRGGDQDCGLLELRPGLHRRLARPRRSGDLRQAARRARTGGRVAPRRRPGRGRGDRDGR